MLLLLNVSVVVKQHQNKHQNKRHVMQHRVPPKQLRVLPALFVG
jgi:hypothetical protein